MKKNPYITENLEFLAETAEKFAQKYIAPGFLERDQSRVFDRDLVKKMGEMGFIAPELPEQYGGQGMGRLAAGIIHEAIAKADLSFSYINLLASLNGQILAEHGQPEVVEPWLKKLTAGEAIFSIALTEPRGGSDAANLRLKIERDGDEYVIHRLGDENKGFVQVMQGFDFSHALIGLQVLAVARVSLDEAWEYAAQLEAFGQPLTAFQGVSHPLAEYETQVEAARLLCLQTLWFKDNHLPHTSEAGMCKWWGPKLAYDVIHQCLLTFGHAGYDRGVMEQRMRDVLGFQIGDGTAQIMKTIIARHKAGRKAVPA